MLMGQVTVTSASLSFPLRASVFIKADVERRKKVYRSSAGDRYLAHKHRRLVRLSTRQTHPYGAASCRDGGKSDAYLGYDGKNAAYPS
jgi:hypothetical protein